MKNTKNGTTNDIATNWLKINMDLKAKKERIRGIRHMADSRSGQQNNNVPENEKHSYQPPGHIVLLPTSK